MSRKLIPLKYFIFYRCSIALNFINFINFYNLQTFLTSLLLRTPSSKGPLKFQSLNKHLGRYLEDLEYSQKVLVWKSFGQNFN